MIAVPNEFALRVRRDELMSRHTSWHVGGPAEIFFEPHDRDDIAAFLRQLPREVPVHWLGLGSNLLVRDAGLRGATILTHGVLNRLERISERIVYCEAGVPCARIAKQCIKWGLGPADFFAGIPGTLGGALTMNAGAFGGETWQHVLEVEVMARDGSCRKRLANEYRVSYRHVVAPADNEWFVSARLTFEHRAGVNNNAMRELLDKRKATQPIGEWSCGSVFTNPPGDHAARLIEASGLKGYRLGGASVSDKHANFIINHGAATAADLERLLAYVQDTVQAKHNVRLQTEVRIVGEIA